MNVTNSQSRRLTAMLQDVQNQIENKSLDDAAKSLTRLSKDHGRDPRLFLLGTQLALASGNMGGALASARRAYDLAPKWHVAQIHLSEVLTKAGMEKEALALARLAIEQIKLIGSDKPAQAQLLRKGATVAQHFGDYALAAQWLERVLQLMPDDLTVRNEFARCLTYAGKPQQAAELLSEMLNQQPDNPALLLNRLRANILAGQAELAIADGERLVAMDAHNEVYRFYLQVARGETPPTQPEAVISELFNAYAAHYDELMLRTHRVPIPGAVAKMISQWHPLKDADILDLGCGTGLLGAFLGPNKGVMVGVDLSADMLTVANQRRVYDRFHAVNLLAALDATPADLYHVITMLDVVSYVGDLQPVVSNALKVLTPGGRLVLTFEPLSDDLGDYKLANNYLYAYAPSYVEKLMLSAGFEGVSLTEQVLRYDGQVEVRGYLAVGQKPVNAIETAAPKPTKNAKRVRRAQ